MSDFTTGKKISFTVFLEHLIYSLMALTWHHIEGKDLLPNLRLHAKEAVKQARGAQEEGAHYFGRRGRIRCRETLTWVSLASQPRGPWLAWTRPHCSPFPSSFPTAPKPLASHPGPGHGGGKHHLAVMGQGDSPSFPHTARSRCRKRERRLYFHRGVLETRCPCSLGKSGTVSGGLLRVTLRTPARLRVLLG